MIQIAIKDSRIKEKHLKTQTEGSAAIDLRACIPDQFSLPAKSGTLISAGIAIYLEDPGTMAIIAPRSGLGHKHRIILGNTIGVIDSDYTGEIRVSLYNDGIRSFVIEPMDRIAQLMILPIIKPEFEIVDSLTETARGSGGFGHSGVK